MADLRIGTCSWKFPSWRGLVYSAEARASAEVGPSYLEEYARLYDTVEIDQWFWSLFGRAQGTPDVRLPRPADVAAYRASVHDRFRFSVKVPNSITLTHLYRKERADPLVPNPHFLSPSLFQEFASRLDPLRDVLGPLLFQFGYLNQHMMTSQEQFQELFSAFCGRLPSGYLYALETRNAAYLNEAYFEFLNRHSLIPVFLQGYWMPPIVSVYEQWRPLVLQQEWVVIRLHGPDREGIELQTGKQWNQIVEPRDEELVAVSEMVQDLLGQGVSVYLNVNNHYEGSAPLTIDRLRRLFGEEPIHQVYTQASFDLPGSMD